MTDDLLEPRLSAQPLFALLPSAQPGSLSAFGPHGRR